MGISFDWKICEILKRLTCAFRRDLPVQGKATKHLRHLDIQEIRSMEIRLWSEEPPCERNPYLRLEDNLDRHGGVKDNHRPSRSAATASATDSRNSTRSRLWSR